MTFPSAITDAMPSDNELRIATVLTVAPLTVSVEGSPVPAGRLASYAPTVNDTVGVLRQDATWLCLGKILGDVAGVAVQQIFGPAEQTANQNLNTAAATLPGTTINFTTYAPNQTLIAWWNADIESIGVTPTVGVVRLLVDGVVVGGGSPAAVFNQANVAIGLRMTVGASMPWTVATAGAHAVALQGVRGAGADGQLRANAVNTALTIMVTG
jgi:hypothetical protein